MKLLYTLFLILGCLLFSEIIHTQPSLSYQRLTNGLAEPDFDEGRTDFAFDDINMGWHILAMAQEIL